MHVGNEQWVADIQKRYSDEITGAKLLELGSLNINGTARDLMKPATWIGIDQTAGPCVDIVCRAAETAFTEAEFDVILSTSMIEHDPDWRESLAHNLFWLKPGGLFLLSWGAEGNHRHDPEPWAAVPVGDVLQWCLNMKLEILEACWEKHRYEGDCMGCYDMVLRKRPA